MFLLTDSLLLLVLRFAFNLNKSTRRRLCWEVCSWWCVSSCNFIIMTPIPWYIWVLALIAQCVAFGEPAMRSAAAKRTECARGWLEAGSAVLHCALGT